jgi:hypothetical protein
MADNTSALYQLYVGIDIAAETFAASWLAPNGPPSAPLTCGQTPQGYAALRQRLERTAVTPSGTLVALEACAMPKRDPRDWKYCGDGTGYAASRKYSWMRPPTTSRRCTGPCGDATGCGVGQRRSSPWCGRASL